MRIIEYSYGQWTPDGAKRVVALGFFDGMHRAHRELMSRAVALAKKTGAVASVFTFSAHSMEKKKTGGLIYSTRDKLKIIAGLGIEEVIVADFNSLCHLSPEDFVEQVLVRDLTCKLAVAGYKFKFGRNALGDFSTLSRCMREAGGEAVILDELNHRGEPLSSSEIRHALSDGRIEWANKMLGAPYFICGRVSRGIGKGHSLGFPTVNTPLPEGCPLKRGVYRGITEIDGKRFSTLTNIGVCPTLGERRAHAETFIIDFDGDLYDTDITVLLLGYLREERLFPSTDELAAQIREDIRITIEKNGELKWQEIGQS